MTSLAAPPRVPGTIRAAALVFVFLGLAFGLSVPFVLAHLDRTGELPMTFGFRSMAGPFVQLGPEAFKALAWSFVAVCAADVVAGIGLWRGRRWGARLGLVTSPLAFALGLGSCRWSSSACPSASPSSWLAAEASADAGR